MMQVYFNIIMIILVIGLIFYCAGLRGRITILENMINDDFDEDDYDKPETFIDKLMDLFGIRIAMPDDDLFNDDDDFNDDPKIINIKESKRHKKENDTDRLINGTSMHTESVAKDSEDKATTNKTTNELGPKDLQLTKDLFIMLYGESAERLSSHVLESENQLIEYCSQHKLLLYDIKCERFRVVKFMDNYDDYSILIEFMDGFKSVFFKGNYATTY